MTESGPGAALVTHATRYAGPPAVRVLGAAGHTVFAHDPGFVRAEARQAFEAQFPGVRALREVDPEDALQAVVAAHPDGPEVLISNQLFVVPPTSIENVDDARLREVFEALVVEPWRWVRATTPHLRARGGGRIVLVTSAAGRRPGARVVPYSAARAAANAMVAGLAKELGADAIAITAIAPNWFASPDTYPQEAFYNNERFRARVERQVPLRRLSAPGEMEALIGYLASPAAAFVTGEVIGFTGGWL